MLVNASRFTGIQELIRNRLHQHLKTIEDAVRVDGGRKDAAARNPEIGELKRCWLEEYSDAGLTWDEVREGLLPVVASAQVLSVNAASSSSLDYEVHDADARNQVIDLDAVWRMQRVNVELERALLAAAEAANHVITSPPAGIRNMSEWAKKQACWAELSKMQVAYDPGFEVVLIDPEAAKAAKRDKRRERQEVDGIEAQRMVLEQGADYWLQWLAFGQSVRQLSPKDAGILQACSMQSNRLPSERQSIAALEIVERLSEHYHASANS